MTVGILGGGQLGRMLALAGYPLGLKFRVLDTYHDAPAGEMAELVVAERFDERQALLDFADGLTLVTPTNSKTCPWQPRACWRSTCRSFRRRQPWKHPRTG